MTFEGRESTGNGYAESRQLWEQFLGGDLEAWERIFTLFYKDLYGYGLKLSARPELTKDCIQELFVVLWERRDHLDEVQSIKAYLLASLRRKLLKRLKKKRKHFTSLEQEDTSHSVDIQFSPEELIIKRERENSKLQALYEAFDALPDRQKEVLYLKYFNGMSYEEIQEILEISYQSIRNHIYRAVKRLRNILNENISEITISLLPFLFSFLFGI
ncbi:RNA polymerase sigma factor [Fodinibius salsisoli]|uniref:Sigma-70 family RNA polymerase sigma factor n=1 Tax=Fodinibius salsisoli TaxID=2820877 RepID=A0ABT3PPL0_9BACT|nr:sigma-70 family RNA polymerase sigma factor [Fodinibius salsisoli]MCW9707800.1 sigma-70 family RNA polymerase sigma factor [Fodinibius salsisoli]